ncbi:translation initiation factor IF-3 [Paenibacillus shirakamiensis]|uniref:Translation initiation factor IF-3 n=1 Tax=Paenibacillus shirakamiensis TaxID=1265935 RepID=A0ABS4JJS3_9BACL|nr:translation initiation factor IF-3 [Paenibacillus shirakamiensis]MBP2001933.1 translation initiation factor IF-3 [Paenibacillus shirakamiensis]
MILNEKIKASEVHLTGLDGEDLGIMDKAEALAMAKQLKVDLVCTSLMSSPPPCVLMGAGTAKQRASQERKKNQPSKIKEIRLTPQIESHDYETKLNQAERLLQSGDAIQLVVRISGKEGPKAKQLLESFMNDLKAVASPNSGIQISGKQAAVQLNPK